MTKKTKKEKIIADYRRKIKLIYQINVPKDYQKSNKKDVPPEEKSDTAEKKFTNNNLDYDLIGYFKKDLKKSLIISFFIIALEFLTYFVMLKIKFN